MNSEEERITELIYALEDEKIRGSVARALGMIGESALPALEKILNTTEDINQKVLIIKAMGMIGRKSVPILIKILQQEEEYWVYSAAIRALRNMGKQADEAIPFLLEELDKEKGKQVNDKIIWSLYEIGYDSNKLAEIIMETLRNAKSNEIHNTMIKIKNIKNLPLDYFIEILKLKKAKPLLWYYELFRNYNKEKTIQKLIELLEEEDMEIRLRGAIALRVMPKEAKNSIPFLNKAMILENNEQIKFEIAYTLLMIEGLEGNAMKELKQMRDNGKLTSRQKWKLDRQIQHQRKSNS